MKVTQVHVGYRDEGRRFISATIDVPGLGEVEIRDCLSTETTDRLAVEVAAALRAKMGILNQPPPLTGENHRIEQKEEIAP